MWMFRVSTELLRGSGCAELPLQLRLPQVLPTPWPPVLASALPVRCCMACARVVWAGMFRTSFLSQSFCGSPLAWFSVTASHLGGRWRSGLLRNGLSSWKAQTFACISLQPAREGHGLHLQRKDCCEWEASCSHSC